MAAPPNSWEELLRKMLPEGAPLPDEDQLDYSISFDYVGPSPFFKPPDANPAIPKSRFTAFPKRAPSLTPRNPSWIKSRSSSDTTSSEIRPFSLTFDDGIESEPESESGNTGDHHEFGDSNSNSNSNSNSTVICEGEGEGGVRVMGCGRCGKKGGNEVWRGRERCIVCGAEYCKKCVLRAMGAMPEGRKCVGCIGRPINEANRRRLGKVSKVLVKLCGRVEVRAIMQVERECRANQVRPEQVVVNGKELREEELDELLGCLVPPRDLRPGRYWYDKDSGLWGKEGAKPERIISSKLNLGGKLQTGASNGDTRVYMNGREITRVELRVLKLAKVQCLPDTHFWLYDDGSYEEEGQNNIKGNIWEKASVRFICSLFSMAVPSERAQRTKEEPSSLSARSVSKNLEEHKVQKLLLLGLDGSGTSTIFKQAKFIYANKYTPEELLNIKLIIQSKMYRYLGTLLEGREHFQEETLMKDTCSDLAADRSVPGETECYGSRKCVYSVNQKISNFCDWLLDLMASGDIDTVFPAAACEHAPVADEIWKDPAIQETYKRREELPSLPDVAAYFLDRVMEISSSEYEPSENDILFAEGVTPTNGIAHIEFSFGDDSAVSELYNEDSKNQQPLPKYELILLSSPKWLDMFEGMSTGLLCVSLTDYNRQWTDSCGLQQNKMVASRDFFESVAKRSCFEYTPFLLLMTKYDVFKDEIEQVPLSVCEWLKDFNPLKTHGKNTSLGHQAFHYIGARFKELYASITGRKLYVRQVNGSEQQSVDEAFRYAREIMEWEEHNIGGIYAMSDDDLLSEEL
ncbi:extra-large guanine nucleotide-binding protein 3-like isoform X1 [Salvia splendens]|uniref:extra-large guanine nucleotide-binding protein 3-like isoform X1 n=1 Tax=Salvia splendens TaxID=180675 RepID=UPI001C2780ED|nr:extra-large guanine nucleotide-binding protein 3-like isoform X1 [Salvia splendens]